MKKIIFTIIAIALFMLSSCTTLLDWGAKTGIDEIKSLTADSTVNKPIDSIKIAYKPVRFQCKTTDTLNYDAKFNQDGYEIWSITAGGIIRTEVKKSDTIIYIYKK
jgi:hypothetical protein